MTPQELKNSILQLAIQGKLVEQRPEEGTAEELFTRIQEEKQQLIKEKKIKKQKTLPEITDDEKPFDIPESWKWCRHNELFEIIGGSQPPKAKFSDIPMEGYVRLYQIRDYGEKPVPVYVSEKLVSKFSEEGDILLARYGGSLGKVFRAKKGAYNVAMAKVEFLFESECVFKDYVFYYYLAPLYQKLVKNNSRSAQAGFNKDDLNNLMFPLPPLAEQKRIVDKIEELLPYIDHYEQAWSKLEQFNSRFPEDMRKSILQYAIQGKLVEQRPEEGTAEELFEQIQKEKQRLIAEKKIKKEKSLPDIKEEEKPFDIPGSWKWVRLGDISIFQGGYAYKSTSYILKSNNQVIRLGNIKQGDFLPSEKQVFISDDLANETDQYRIKANDILISMTGTRRKKDYFYAVIIDQNMLKDTAYYLNQRVGCFRTFKNIYPQFLYYALRCETLREIIFTKETGTANQGNLGSEDIKKYVYIPLPPLGEQKRIVQKLEQLLPLCEQLR